jgi:hypothetical protein
MSLDELLARQLISDDFEDRPRRQQNGFRVIVSNSSNPDNNVEIFMNNGGAMRLRPNMNRLSRQNELLELLAGLGPRRNDQIDQQLLDRLSEMHLKEIEKPLD